VYRFFLLLGIVVCAAAGASSAQTFFCPTSTEDMLNYFIMNYPDRADYFMGPGNANPIYSSIFPDNGSSFSATGYFVWTKGAGGYPWDVKTFDQGFVYDRSTELTNVDRSADIQALQCGFAHVSTLRDQGSSKPADSDSSGEFEIQFLFCLHGLPDGQFEERAEPDFCTGAGESRREYWQDQDSVVYVPVWLRH
jgi:hypothetical protein